MNGNADADRVIAQTRLCERHAEILFKKCFMLCCVFLESLLLQCLEFLPGMTIPPWHNKGLRFRQGCKRQTSLYISSILCSLFPAAGRRAGVWLRG